MPKNLVGQIGVGVIGYGYWGPNLVRNFHNHPQSKVIAVSDLNSERLMSVVDYYPNIKTTLNYRDILKSPEIDVVAIATPVSTHYELALQALLANKHVLVEKPIANTSQQVLHLIEEADKRNLILMVDHTFAYTSAVVKMSELVADGHLGNLYYYDSVRVNLGIIQPDVNVLWDLAVHDLAIINTILPDKPLAVSATGVAHIKGSPETSAYMTLFFSGTTIAHIHVSWLAPVKIRQTILGGSDKTIIYNDLEPSEKVKVYDRGITVSENSSTADRYQQLVGYRTGDMWAPKLEPFEALYVEIDHLLNCINYQQKPKTAGEEGLKAVKILEAACLSMQQKGSPITIH